MCCDKKLFSFSILGSFTVLLFIYECFFIKGLVFISFHCVANTMPLEFVNSSDILGHLLSTPTLTSSPSYREHVTITSTFRSGHLLFSAINIICKLFMFYVFCKCTVETFRNRIGYAMSTSNVVISPITDGACWC